MSVLSDLVDMSDAEKNALVSEMHRMFRIVPLSPAAVASNTCDVAVAGTLRMEPIA